MKSIPILIAALGAGCLPVAAQAQNLVLPVAPVLAQPLTQAALQGMPVRFGASAQPGAGAEVQARSWARPTAMRSYSGRSVQLPDGRVVAMTTEQTCELALRYTLQNLADESRKRGGKAVVDIVSFNGGVEMNSASTFECVPGKGSSTVSLKGRVSD